MKPMSNDRRRLLVNAAANALGFVFQVIVTFYLAPLLVRGLGHERYGLWSLVDSILAYLTLLDLGVAASVVRYVARFDASGDRTNLNKIFSTSLCLFTAAGAVAFLLALAAAGLIALCNVPPELLGEVQGMMLLLGVNLAIGLPFGVFASVLDGLGRFPAKTAVRTVGLLLRSGLMLFILAHGGGLLELAVIITVCNLAEHLGMAVAAWCYLPHLRFSLRLADRETFRTIRGYSLDAFVTMVAGRIMFQTDALVIGSFLGPGPITPFALANRLVDYAKNSLRTTTTALTPLVSAAEARQDGESIRRVLLDVTRWILWIVVPIQLGLLLLGHSFQTLWLGAENAEASYRTLLILSIPLSLAMAQSVASRIFYGTGRLRWFTRLVVGEAIANLVLSLLLVGPLGIEGVALGTAIPNVIGSILTTAYACRVVEVNGWEYVRRSFLGPIVLGVVPLVVWLVTLNWMPITSWSTFCVVGASGMSVYLPLVAVAEFGPNRVARKAVDLAVGSLGGLFGNRRGVRTPLTPASGSLLPRSPN